MRKIIFLSVSVPMLFFLVVGCKWKHSFRTPYVREIHVRRDNPSETNFIVKEQLSKKEVEKIKKDQDQEWKRIKESIK